MQLTKSFPVLLQSFESVFTKPSFATFGLLMTGWIISVRHRFVTDLIVSSDSTGNGHFSDCHRFFSSAAWNSDHLGKILGTLVVDSLYSGKSVLPANVDLIGPVHSKAALYQPAAAQTGVRRGPRRKKGNRLPGIDAWQRDRSKWKVLEFDQYGLHGTLRVKSRTGLYFKAGKDRLPASVRLASSTAPICH